MPVRILAKLKFLEEEMLHLLKIPIVVSAAVLTVVITWPSAGLAEQNQEIENLRAFTKLYGYVRWFHPSGEAAAADWWQVATDGASAVRGAANSEELESHLNEVFLPLAPSLRLEATGQYFSPPPGPSRDDYDANHIVSWQHSGVGLGNIGYGYQSVRTGCPDQIPLPSLKTWSLTRSFSAIEYRGREIRLRVAARAMVTTDDTEVGMQIYSLRGFPTQIGFHKVVEVDTLGAGEWQVFEMTALVGTHDHTIVISGFLGGDGAAWFDAFELDVRSPDGSWETVNLVNLGFENQSEPMVAWTTSDFGLTTSIDELNAFEGLNSARLMSRRESSPLRIFTPVPGAEDIINKEIGGGLRCILPLWLIDDNQRIGNSRDFSSQKVSPLPSHNDALQTHSDPTAESLAVIIITWNIMQHFYPYFDVVDVDWDAELTTALEGALVAQDQTEFGKTLEKMIAALDDGHGLVFNSTIDSLVGWLPVRPYWVEGQIVVAKTLPMSDYQRGDIIVSIDGIPGAEVLNNQTQYLSGTLQRKRAWALREFGIGPKNSVATVIVDRIGERIEILSPRIRRFPTEDRPMDSVTELEAGIFYVDLSRASISYISTRINEIAAAYGVIFDLRGYPNSNDAILSHLSSETLRSAHWNIPQIIYPDQENITGWDPAERYTWDPAKPQIQGTVVFLCDGKAMSYSETIMGVVEAYELAEIVGRPTAGVNGKVNPINLPGGWSIYWTGMKVLKHDGSQHHLIGIQPTVLVERTITAVREGRDEDIEAALELIKSR